MISCPHTVELAKSSTTSKTPQPPVVSLKLYSLPSHLLPLSISSIGTLISVVLCVIGTPECIVKAEKAKGGFDYFLCEPLIISGRRTLRTRYTDHSVGWSKEWYK